MSLLKSTLNMMIYASGSKFFRFGPPQDQQDQKGLKNQFQSLLPMD